MSSKLLSLLKAVANQISLSSPLGRWMQAVTDVASVVSEAPYSIASRITAVQHLDGADNIILNGKTVDAGITYDETTGLWSLVAGKLYEFEFFGLWQSFNATTDSVVVEWVNSTTNTPLVDLGSAPSTARPVTGTTNASSQAVSKVLYRPTQNITVRLRATQVVGSADLSVDSYAIVRQVG